MLFNRFYQPDFDLERLEVVPSLWLSTTEELRLRLHWTAILSGRVQADLAVTDSQNAKVSLLLGNGNGGFTAAAGSPISIGGQPIGVVAGDLNHDGKLDLVLANYGSNNVAVLLGQP